MKGCMCFRLVLSCCHVADYIREDASMVVVGQLHLQAQPRMRQSSREVPQDSTTDNKIQQVFQNVCTSVSKRSVQLKDFPLSVVIVTSWPGRISLTLVGRLMVNRSCPVRPNVSASSPALKQSGMIPIPTKLLRWIRSKLFEITAFTP